MNSLRVRLLFALMTLLALAAIVMGAVTYRNVLAETESLFDYQLRQMALSLRDQGEIAPDQARAFADEQLDFVIQIWTVDGRNIYASRPHSSLPARALLGLHTLNVDGQAWRTYSVATRERSSAVSCRFSAIAVSAIAFASSSSAERRSWMEVHKKANAPSSGPVRLGRAGQRGRRISRGGRRAALNWRRPR